jgi:gamma-glutamyltranspeptidase/glutathione hydrolase
MMKHLTIGLGFALAACTSALPPPSLAAPPAGVAGMVVAADPRAAEAGRWVLRENGSAADAAMAMMLALTVVEPQSSGIGGGGFLVHHDGRTPAIATIDGRETAPATARPERFLGKDGKPLPFREAAASGLSVGVPGNIRLMARAHQRWGTLSWKKLFEPAINLADNGFLVTPALHTRLGQLSGVWQDFPQARAIYYGKDGKPRPVGERIKNHALANALRRIADEGPSAFYQGAGGQAITRAVAAAPRHPSVLSATDLAAYRAKDRDAVCGRYRTYRICGMGPPSSGATTVLGILGMVERFDLAALGADDPRAWHVIAEAMRLAYADRDKYLGDSDFVSVPVSGLIDPAYLGERSKLIAIDATRRDYPAGSPPGARPRTAGTDVVERGTTHFVATDRNGNVASMTSTVEGPFGSQIVADGFFLNNELTDFSFIPSRGGAPVANRIEPGKRPLSSMSPTIVYDQQGRVLLALGSAGGKRIIMHVAKTLIGVLDWGLPPDEAIALANIYFSDNGLLVEQGTPVAAMQRQLAALGHTVVAADLPSKVTAVQRTDSGWQGAADPRSEGVALGE